MQSFVIATGENGRFSSASNRDFCSIFADVALQSIIREPQRAVAQFDRQAKSFAATVEPLRLYSEPGRGLANGEQSVFLIRRFRERGSKKPMRLARRPARPRIAPEASRSFQETSFERAKVRAIDPRASSHRHYPPNLHPLPAIRLAVMVSLSVPAKESIPCTPSNDTCDGAAIYIVRACARADYR